MTPNDKPLDKVSRELALYEQLSTEFVEMYGGELVSRWERAFKDLCECPDIELPAKRAAFLEAKHAAEFFDERLTTLRKQKDELSKSP